MHSTEERIYFNNGTSVPTKTIKEEDPDDDGYYYDYEPEYVIYDTKLVNIKYIIELED